MKKFLVALNVILACILAYGLFNNLRSYVKSREEAATSGLTRVRKKSSGDKKLALAGRKGTSMQLEREVTLSPAITDQNEKEIIQKIADRNIFNPERSPNAGVRRGRVELTLVGTFTIGKVGGAIIKHKFQQNTNANLFGPMGLFNSGVGMMPPREITTRTGGGRSTSSRNASGNAGGGMRGGNRGNMRMGMMGPRMGMMGGMMGNSSTQNQKNSYRQYVRIGETLSNGYTLVEVSRNRAVLTRGGDRMELEIQESSKGITRSTPRRRQGFAQTMQNLMQQNMQQMQNLARQNMYQNRMMQNLMRQNMQNQRGSSGRRR